MKRISYLLAALLLLLAAPEALSRGGKNHVIGFYNLENLFDTAHDRGKNDIEYLPDGTNAWTDAKYRVKLRNMARVIRAMKDDNKVWHAILGVSEIENRHVLEDLVLEPDIREANFQIIHYDGPDRRGVDVALLYRPEVFEVLETRSIPFDFNSSRIRFTLTAEEQERFRTRDILMVRGLLDGEMFAFFVAHLPSRIGGKGQDLRSRGGEIMYEQSMALMREYPGIKIVAMGDMNDNPTDDSMAVYMRGKEKIERVGAEDFFSPFVSMLKAGYGSLAYQGEWNIYDLILVNSNLAHARKGSFQIIPVVRKKYYGRIFQKPFMTQEEGQYRGTPHRTSSGGMFTRGYSDHYPTYIVVSTKHD